MELKLLTAMYFKREEDRGRRIKSANRGHLKAKRGNNSTNLVSGWLSYVAATKTETKRNRELKLAEGVHTNRQR